MNQIKRCKSQNFSRGEMSTKKKVKIRTQNGKIVETGIYVTKHIKTVCKGQEETVNVSNRMNYL